MDKASNPDGTEEVKGGRGSRRRAVGARTRERILDTAQELFAAKGVDGVSINEICKQCDVNSAAVHYHFGSKSALVEEILRRGVGTWGQQRDQLIEQLTAAGTPTLSEVVSAMVRPTADLVKEPWGMNYIRFLFGISNHPDYAELSNSVADSHTARYVALLSAVLPDLPRDLLLRRYTLTRMFLYQALVIEHGPLATWLQMHGVDDDGAMEEHLISYFTAALAAPDETSGERA